ncbi:PAS domain S-box protein [Methanogenium marinum]|uniref:histidine kinase n=1 Tax=Methanogenium marinum TaxID=348610 RepID=A0A9Q4KTJ9_9EURY|nr:PAS domain S-box protein [Methanogenium marinum]MDE4908552.1 PAS domain S-box protein [Methanogenium marinum]
MSFISAKIPDDSSLWDILIVITSLFIGLVITFSLYAGYESVFPHLIDIPIILFAYRYPRRGVWFAVFVSVLYLVLYGIIINPTVPGVGLSEAAGRVLIFLVIGATVSYLSYRLRNSEDTYRNLFDNLSNAAFTIKINPDGTLGRFMDVNAMMCAAVGYTRDEMFSMSLYDIVPDAYAQWLHSRLEGQNLDTYGELESFHLAKDGREVPVEVKVHLFDIESGPIILATAIDMTERYHRNRILKAQRDVAISLNHARDSEEAVRLVIGFALEISTLDAGAYYFADKDCLSFSHRYSTGFSGRFMSENEKIKASPKGISAIPGWNPVYGSVEDLVRAGVIRGSGEYPKMIGILPVMGSNGVLGLFLLSSYGTPEIPDTERRLIEALVAQAGAGIDRLNAVRALRQSRQDLCSLVDSLDAYQALAGPDEKLIAANRSFAAASGIGLDFLPGNNIISLTGRADEFQSFLRDSFSEVLKSGQAVRFEDEGEGRFFDTILYPVLSSDGTVRAVGMLSTDISPLKEAEAALLETERRYRLVIEALNLGVFDIRLPEMTMTVSPEWYTMLGYDGDLPGEVYSFWIEHLHPDDRDSVLILADMTFQSGEEYFNEYRMRAADGTWRWIKSHGKVISVLPDGKPGRLIGTHSDITRRRRAETAFRRTNRLLRDAQKVARLGYYEYDVGNDLILPDAGIYEILNISDEEPVYTFHEFCGFIHPDEREQVEKGITAAVRDNRSYSNIYRIIARGGPEIWVRAWIEPGTIKDGNYSPVFGAMQDITDVRQTEEELLRTQIAVETSRDEVLYISPNGEIIYGNQQAVNAYGIDGSLAGLTVGDIDPVYTQKKWQLHWADLRVNKFRIRESWHRKNDGSVFPVEVVENYVKVGTREFSCVYYRDITDRRIVENALRESEQRLSLAVLGANLGIWDWDMTSDHMVFDARFAEIMGVAPKEMEAGTFGDLMALVHPRERRVFRKVLEDYIAEKGLPFLSEFRMRHRDGTWRWVRGRGVIVSHDPSGTGRRMIGTIMDINEQREAMDALAEREEQLRETQDIARVGGWRYEIPEDRYSFDRGTLDTIGFGETVAPTTLGEFFHGFVYPEDSAVVEEAYSQHLKEYVPFDMVYRARLPDGRIRYLHSRCQTIFDSNGVPQKSVGIVQEVTGLKEAENALLEREWKVNEAQRITHIRFWECDSSFMTFSRTDEGAPLCQLTFLERDGLKVHPNDCEWLTVKFRESVENKREFSEEFRAVLEENGDLLHLFCRGSHYYRTNGTYLRSLGTIIDITERVKTVNALQESERKFRLVAENPSIGTYIIQENRFVYVNDTCARFFGYSIEGMIGMEAAVIIAPEVRGELDDIFRECTAGVRDEIHLEVQGFTLTGIAFPVEIFGSSGEYGGKPAVIGTIIDITERKAYEEMLTVTRLTVDQATIGVGWFNRTGEFIYVNAQAAEMLRIPAETLLGKKIWEIHSSLTPLRWEEFWERIFVGENQQFETVQKRGDGTSFPAEITVDYVHLGEMEFACIFVTDISLRREAEDALKQSLAEKTMLLQEVHHRVKNNLALISSMIQMQMRTLDDEQAISSLTETANRIISMAMVHESIYRSRNITTIDAQEHLMSLVNEVIPNFSVGKAIEVSVDAHGCTLDLNSGILYSLIVNELITNSIKYAFDGRDAGKISIVMDCNGEEKVLIISDDGVGIPDNVDPFRQRSLGMNIVQSVVTGQLGGTIELVRGEGTTWVLTFPKKLA